MPSPAPVYTIENCKFASPLQWGLTVFWRQPIDTDPWLNDLNENLEPDGIRLLQHRFVKPGISQFLTSTIPPVSPKLVVQRVKGRLQHLINRELPRPFKRNYSICSIGKVTRQTVERYVAEQLNHHTMADRGVQKRFAKYQIARSQVDLSAARATNHGMYLYNLHIVIVHQERWMETHDKVLQSVVDMLIRVCDSRGWLLSRGGILADHVHLLVGPSIDVPPVEVALSMLNNLAFVRQMQPVYQFGGYVGTVGEYGLQVIGDGTSLHPDEPGGGEEG